MRIIAILLVLEAILQSSAFSADFDIGTSDHPEFFVESHQECTLTHRTYRPVKDDLAVTVSHNERRLWNTREGERCVNVKVSSRGQSPLFLHVVYTRENVEEHYYWIFRRDWIMCMKSEYEEALENESMQTINIDSPSAFLGSLHRIGRPVKEEMFVANEKCKITAVERGEDTLWEAGKNDKLLSYMLLSESNKVDLLHLVSTNGEEFYELSGGAWTKITKKEFKERDDKMSTYKLAIDINDVKSDKYDMSEYKCAGFPATSFTPKRHLSFVTDDGAFICSFASGVKIKKVTVYKGSTKKFMDVEYYRGKRNAHAYFINWKDSWEKATMEDYYAALRRQPEFDTSSPTSLNIRSPDEKMCRIEDTGNPVYERVIIPKNEFKVTKVYDNTTAIWEAETTEYILKATVYFNNGKPALLTLEYADLEKHFERSDDGSWSQFYFNYRFNSKVNGLKKKMLALKINETNTVDISVRDRNICGFSEYKHCGIPTVSFMPKGKVRAIKDGDQTIHIFPEEKTINTMFLYITKELQLLDVGYKEPQRFRSDLDIHLHFEKGEKRWDIIKKDEFNETFRDLSEEYLANALDEEEEPESPGKNKQEPPVPNKKECKLAYSGNSLDITGGINLNACILGNEKMQEALSVTIIPKEEDELTQITDGSDVIWEASGGEKCIQVWLYHKDGEADHIEILLNDLKTHRHFYKKGGHWENEHGQVLGKTTRNASKERLAHSLDGNAESLGSSKPRAPPKGIYYDKHKLADPGDSLDIMGKIDPSVFLKDKSKPKEPLFVTITPKEDQKLREIHESGDIIWKASGEEKCITVWIDHKDGKPNLLHILVEGSTGIHKYFEKQEGEWLPITEDAYKEAQQKQIDSFNSAT